MTAGTTADATPTVTQPTAPAPSPRRPGLLTELRHLVRPDRHLPRDHRVWEWYASDKSIALIAPPSKVAESFYEMVIVDQSLIVALAGSIVTMFIGLTLAMLVAVPLGISMGRSTTLDAVLDPYVTFLYVLPSVAFVPVLVVMLGIDFQLRLALIFLSAVFPILINTIAGVKHVDQELDRRGAQLRRDRAPDHAHDRPAVLDPVHLRGHPDRLLRRVGRLHRGRDDGAHHRRRRAAPRGRQPHSGPPTCSSRSSGS